MTVSRKIILVPLAVGSALCLILLLTWFSGHRTQTLFLQADQASRNHLANTVLSMKREQMQKVLFDYTYWTELLRFVAAPVPGWAADNIDSVVVSFPIDLMLLYNRNLQRVHYVTNSNFHCPVPDLPREMLEAVAEKRLHHFFMQTCSGLLEVSAGSIHPSDDPQRKTAPAGLLLLGRLWNKNHLERLSGIIRLDLALDDPHLRTDPFAEPEQSSRRTLENWEGKPLAVLTMRGENPHYRELLKSEKRFLLLLAVFSLGIMLVLVEALRRWIRKPLGLLRHSLETEEVEHLPALAKIGPEYRDLAMSLGEHFIQRRRLERETALRKRVATNLAASEARYRTLFEKMIDGFLHCEKAGDGYRIREANPACLHLLGRGPEELHGISLTDALPWLPSAGPDLAASLAGRSITCEVPDNRHLRIAGYVPEPEQLVLLIEDISAEVHSEQARRKLESQLIQAQKLESIGTMAGGVAHEINNPLMCIINFAQLIDDRLPEQHDDLHEFSKEILAEGQRIAKIVRSLLAFSRQETERFSTARIGDLVATALRLVGNMLKQEDIRIKQEIPDDLPAIQCDHQQIEQVLINLLLNARHALNEKFGNAFHKDKQITITAEKTENNGKTHVLITLHDRGTGIPNNIRARLFDPFFTTKAPEQGTGLGLSISYGIIIRHGGTISVESTPGESTSFLIELPVLQEENRQG